jgi:hypothetical protein
MTERRIWCSVTDVNAMDVMRLIDLIADLDTPSASELRAFADRALVQVQTASLRIGVATDGGRPIADILALVDGMGIKRDVWSMSSIDRPTGVDAWVVVVGPDGDLSKEKRFLARIAEMEKAVIALGNDPSAMSALGVPPDRIFFGTHDLTGLGRIIERWQLERDAIRSGVISAHARPALDALSRDQSALDDRLRRLPDVAEAAGALADFETRSSLALDAVTTASGEVVEEIRGEVVRCFSDWVEVITANHGDRPNRERVQESLEKWLRDRFAKSFADRLGRRVGTHAELVPQLRAALAALEQHQVMDFATPAVDVPEHADPSALRWLFPLAGGGLGAWRGGWKLGLVGAALGMVIARILKTRAKRPLRSKALKTAAANHVSTHLDSVAQRMIEALRHDCELEKERLKEAVRAAEATKPERDRIHATLEQLAKARALLA